MVETFANRAREDGGTMEIETVWSEERLAIEENDDGEIVLLWVPNLNDVRHSHIVLTATGLADLLSFLEELV
jgi:hypothetical protein